MTRLGLSALISEAARHGVLGGSVMRSHLSPERPLVAYVLFDRDCDDVDVAHVIKLRVDDGKRQASKRDEMAFAWIHGRVFLRIDLGTPWRERSI